MLSLVLGPALVFSQTFAPQSQCACRSEVETHCLDPEGLPFARYHA
jgi:hypothetical protein